MIDNQSSGSASASQPQYSRQTSPSVSPRMAMQMHRLDVRGSPKRKNFLPQKHTIGTKCKDIHNYVINEIFC